MDRLRRAQEEAEVRARRMEDERRQMGRSAAMTSHDPLMILRSRYWPVPRTPDGDFDVLAYGRALDAAANRGAGAPR